MSRLEITAEGRPGTAGASPATLWRTALGALRITIGVLLLGTTLIGLPYYLAPMAERVRHPLHVWFKPSGYAGQTAGILALLLFLFMWLYPLRKKFRWMAGMGSLSRWLEIHIIAGLALPIVGAIHAGWRFHGLIGLGYASMLLVSLSGIVGRYLYARIPRTRSGVELSLDEIEIRRREMVARIAAAMRLDPREVEADLAATVTPRGGGGLVSSLFNLIAGDLRRWRAVRVLGKRWSEEAGGETSLNRKALSEAVRLARRQVGLAQQVRRLDATQRLFRLWHIAHRPIAITALISIFIHVTVVVALGVTWLW